MEGKLNEASNQIAKHSNSIDILVKPASIWMAITRANGDKYEGDVRNWEPDGEGVSILHNGEKYEGNFHEGYFHGKGTLTCANGKKLEGEFIDDEFQGNDTCE